MSRLQHPNCVSVIDFGVDGSPYLVMDFVTGKTLREVMQAGPVSTDRAFKIAQQLLAGMAHAHAQGIVHRDLKPENLILERRGGARAAPADPRFRAGQAARRAGHDRRAAPSARPATCRPSSRGHGDGRRAHRPLRGGRAAVRDAGRARSRSSRRTSASSSSCTVNRRRRSSARRRRRRGTPRRWRRPSQRRWPSSRRTGFSRPPTSRRRWRRRRTRRGGATPERRPDPQGRTASGRSPPRPRSTPSPRSGGGWATDAPAESPAAAPAPRRTAWMILGGFVLVVLVALSIGRGLGRKVGTVAETGVASAPTASSGASAPAGTGPGRAGRPRRRQRPRARAHRSSRRASWWRRDRPRRRSQLLEQLRTEKPNDADAPYMLATIYFDQHRWSEALTAAQVAVHLNPGYKTDGGSHSGRDPLAGQ